MKVLLFRHGEVRYNGEKVFIGRTDLPLSAEGRHQAEAWKHCLQKRPPGSIVSSPLSRALEFARIVAGDRAVDVAVCRELSEIDLGDWDGRLMSSIQQRDPTSWQERGKNLARFQPLGGESFEDVQKRAVPAFEKLVNHNVPELIIVSHAGVNRVLLCYLLGMPLEHMFSIDQDYACLNVLESGICSMRISSINVPCPGKEPNPKQHG